MIPWQRFGMNSMISAVIPRSQYQGVGSRWATGT
jgi:hypothetical protein